MKTLPGPIRSFPPLLHPEATATVQAREKASTPQTLLPAEAGAGAAGSSDTCE